MKDFSLLVMAAASLLWVQFSFGQQVGGKSPIAVVSDGKANASQSRVETKKRLLLIGGPYDHHPKGTHEYMAGMRIVAKCLENVDGLHTRITNSEDSWIEGPGMIAGADGIVLFREQGARWMQQAPDRVSAFEGLAKRGGGFVALHFGMGTVDPKYIDRFVALFGGCHGGPDRRDGFFTINAHIAESQHPICRGLRDFKVNDEFYHRLKFVKTGTPVTSLIQGHIEDSDETVCWVWERDNGGRSFGFSGLHVHSNWKLPEYRRLVTHAILWTLKMPIPEEGVDVDVPDDIFLLDAN